LKCAPPASNSAASEPRAIVIRLASLILRSLPAGRLLTESRVLLSEPHEGDTRAVSGDPWKGDKLGNWTT